MPAKQELGHSDLYYEILSVTPRFCVRNFIFTHMCIYVIYLYIQQCRLYPFGSHVCCIFIIFMSVMPDIFVLDTSNFIDTCEYVLCILNQ